VITGAGVRAGQQNQATERDSGIEERDRQEREEKEEKEREVKKAEFLLENAVNRNPNGNGKGL
jgi:hypothetical protein